VSLHQFTSGWRGQGLLIRPRRNGVGHSQVQKNGLMGCADCVRQQAKGGSR